MSGHTHRDRICHNGSVTFAEIQRSDEFPEAIIMALYEETAQRLTKSLRDSDGITDPLTDPRVELDRITITVSAYVTPQEGQ